MCRASQMPFLSLSGAVSTWTWKNGLWRHLRNCSSKTSRHRWLVSHTKMLVSVWQRCTEKVSLSGQHAPISGKDWISESGYIPPHPHSWTKLTVQDFPVGNLQLDSQCLQKLLPGGGAGRKRGSTALSTVHFSLPRSLPPFQPCPFSIPRKD